MIKKIFVATFILLATCTSSYAQTEDESSLPPHPPEVPLPTKKVKKPSEPKRVEKFDDRDAQEFLARNPTIKSFNYTDGNMLEVELKSGAIERYMLDENSSALKAKAKYGYLPVPPPPPPPAPPAIVAF
jgi:hypothetical protein